MTIGERLETARKLPRKGKPKGQTIRETCDEVGISPDTYHKLKSGRTTTPHPTTVKAIEAYISKAERAHSRLQEAK